MFKISFYIGTCPPWTLTPSKSRPCDRSFPWIQRNPRNDSGLVLAGEGVFFWLILILIDFFKRLDNMRCSNPQRKEWEDMFFCFKSSKFLLDAYVILFVWNVIFWSVVIPGSGLLCWWEPKKRQQQIFTKFSRVKDSISWIPACLPKMRCVQDSGCFTRVHTHCLGHWRHTSCRSVHQSNGMGHILKTKLNLCPLTPPEN